MHHSAPGNVYDSDFGFMDSHLCAPVPASTNPLPGHLVPGTLFDDDCSRYFQPEPLESYAAIASCQGDYNTIYRSLHPNFTAERDTNATNELIGWGMPSSTDCGLNLGLVGADEWSLPYVPELSSDCLFDPWTGRMDADVHTWDIPDLFAPALNATTTSTLSRDLDLCFPVVQMEPLAHSPHRLEPTADASRVCKWCVNGTPCNAPLSVGTDLKHAVAQHLYKAHRLLPSGAKAMQQCMWRGCGKQLKQESIVRHIVTVHLHLTTACHLCGTSFARRDSLQRHVRNSCGVGK